METEHPFITYCKQHRLRPTVKNASLWDAAVKAGMERQKKNILRLVSGYTAPIHNGVDGAVLATEIYDAISEHIT